MIDDTALLSAASGWACWTAQESVPQEPPKASGNSVYLWAPPTVFLILLIAILARRRRARNSAGRVTVTPLEKASPPLKAGMLGKAETDCQPNGAARFGDQVFAVINQGRPIKKGEFVVIRAVTPEGQVVILPKPLNSI
jgi:hypothetical protein